MNSVNKKNRTLSHINKIKIKVYRNEQQTLPSNVENKSIAIERIIGNGNDF